MDKYDKHPKRRKHKDNPYTLESIEEKKIYKVSFSDLTGKKYEVDINEEVYNILDKFELEDLKELNEFDRHTEHLEQSEESLYRLSTSKQESIDDYVIRKSTYEELIVAINKLPETQKRRIKMYYFEEKTLENIGNIEHCSKVAVKHSIDDGIMNLKKFLKN